MLRKQLKAESALHQKVREGVREEAEELTGPYHWRKEDEFPGTLQTDEQAAHFLMTKKVHVSPRRSLEDLKRTRASRDDPASAQPPPNRQLQKVKEESIHNNQRSVAGRRPSSEMTIEATRTGQEADSSLLARTQADIAIPSNNTRKTAADIQISPLGQSQYVLEGRKEPVPERTWLQDAQEREAERARAEGSSKSPSRSSSSPLRGIESERDRYAVSQREVQESLLPTVPAGLFVQPLILERQKEKDMEREREIERGAIVQGSAVTMQPSVAVSTIARKESRLRAMLKQATVRHEQRFSNTSISSQWSAPDLNKRHQTPSCTSVTSLTLAHLESGDQQQQGVFVHSIEEESSRDFTSDLGTPVSHEQPTPVPSISVSFLDPLQKRQHAAIASKRAASTFRTDPFSLVRTEEQRRKRMEKSNREAPGRSSRVLAKTAVATTVIQTNIAPCSLLQGNALATPSHARAHTSLDAWHDHSQHTQQTLHAAAESEGANAGGTRYDDARVQDESQPTKKCSPSMSPVREFMSSKTHADDFTFFSAEKAHNLRLSPERRGQPTKSRHDLSTSISDAAQPALPANATVKGGREEAVVVGKLPVTEIERCRKGCTCLASRVASLLTSLELPLSWHLS